jgi:hypothetical protein
MPQRMAMEPVDLGRATVLPDDVIEARHAQAA